MAIQDSGCGVEFDAIPASAANAHLSQEERFPSYSQLFKVGAIATIKVITLDAKENCHGPG